jgi:hypothetical protein
MSTAMNTESRKRKIERADIIDWDAYARIRKERRAGMVALKRNRRIQVGPNATVHFESFDTMLYQVQEMLHTERGGEAQILDELEAYNPLIPKGNELVATLMLEMADPERRSEFLAGLGGVEQTVSLDLGGERALADWERDVERTTSDGKTSAVHFLHFRLSPQQAAKFREPGAEAVFFIRHPNYGYATVLPEAVRAELAKDL